MEYNPRHFQGSITVTLKKGGPRDFRLPKSYGPVALLNTLGKLLESIIATRIAWLAKDHEILPKGHFLNPREGQQNENEDETAQQNDDIWDIANILQEGHAKMPLQLDNIVIQPSESAKYLGIYLDKHLKLNMHRQKLLAKANGSLEALRDLAGFTWGMPLLAMRKIYQAVVIPQMLYGLSAWYCPLAQALPARELRRISNEFTKIQRRAAIMISGAFKSTSAAALNIELHLLPVKLLMDQMIQEAALRIQIGPECAHPGSLRALLITFPFILRASL